jgi:hypothetical protein
MLKVQSGSTVTGLGFVQRAEKGRDIFDGAERADRNHVARFEAIGLHCRRDAVDEVIEPGVAQLALAVDPRDAIRRIDRGLSDQGSQRDEIRHDVSLSRFLFCFRHPEVLALFGEPRRMRPRVLAAILRGAQARGSSG